MLSQVLGLLFGPNDMMNDSSEKPIVRKRGRPPLFDRDHISSTDLHAHSNDSDNPRRKRGRPRKEEETNTTILKSNMKADKYTDRQSDSQEYLDNNRSQGSIRRSRRYRPPDPFKDLFILLPSDDPIIRLGVPDNEIADLTACLDDPVELDSDDDEEIAPRDDELVFTPCVREIIDDSSIKLEKQSISKFIRNVSTESWFDYTTYDADSEDEAFVDNLSTDLSLTDFQIVISVLEREFELSRNLSPLIADSAMAQQKCEMLVSDSESIVQTIDRYIALPHVDSEKKSLIDSLLCSMSSFSSSLSLSVSPRNDSTNSIPSFNQAPISFSEIRLPKHRTFSSQQIGDFLSLTNTRDTVVCLLETLNINESTIDSITSYYVDKRSRSKSSLLRCYHDFIMDNWSRDSLSQASAPIDRREGSETTSNQIIRLVSLRKDLDKARLIADRVRRREKLKRDLIRFCSEHNNNEEISYSMDDNTNDVEDSDNDTVATDTSNNIKSLTMKTITASTIRIANKPSTITTTASRSVSVESTGHTQTAISNWTQEEDMMLLLGVAACGLGRWTEIREDFALTYRNSAQMNQRFFRLTKRRISRLASSSTSVFDSSSPPWQMRHTLTALQKLLLDTFDEEVTWNRIALRFLFDNHQQEIRSGRPVKHPIQIPIPKEYKLRAFLKFKHLLSRRPSSPSFRPPVRTKSSNEIEEQEIVNNQK